LSLKSLMHSQAIWILIAFEGIVGPFRGFNLGYLRARHTSSLHSNMLFIIFFEAIADFLAWISVLIRHLARTGHSCFRVEWSFSVVCTFQAISRRPTMQKLKFHNFISASQQHKSGLACLFFKVSMLHSDTHTPAKTPLKKAATYTTHNNSENKHSYPRRNSNPRSQQSSGRTPTP
jgi:hypothetical protein